MIKLDNALLVELGLGELPASHRKALLQIIYEELEMRVGQRISQAMTEKQLTRFGTFIDIKDEAAALAWLEEEMPHYRDVVAAEFDLLRTEIHAHVEDIKVLSSVYVEIPIELPRRTSPWGEQSKTVDEQSPVV